MFLVVQNQTIQFNTNIWTLNPTLVCHHSLWPQLEHWPDETQLIAEPTYLQFWKALPFQQMAMSKQKYFLSSHMPYPKKTNMMGIWALQIQAIVCVRVWLTLCLPCLLFGAALLRPDCAATEYILMLTIQKKKKL